MAQAQSQRYTHGDNQFPILYGDGRIRVYKNPTNEIFVEDIKTGVTLRISSDTNLLHGGLKFTTDSLVEPTVHNGRIAWNVSKRR